MTLGSSLNAEQISQECLGALTHITEGELTAR